jgi:hypothetical protein
MKLREDFLQYVWKTKHFSLNDLVTTDGNPITIECFGEHNPNAGPDFLDARIKVQETLWAGNIEVHVKSSDWNRHKHQNDKAYDNVILHVVYEEDEPIARYNGQNIPCLELRKRISPKLAHQYVRLMNSEDWIPCQKQFPFIDDLTKTLLLDRLLVERLERRILELQTELAENNGDWEGLFYQRLAKSLGAQVNKEPFWLLAKLTPLLTLLKHKDQLFQLEAILFGQAGFLEDNFEEEYPNRLKKEYSFLQKKYMLFPMMQAAWRFMRLRPANFPTVRIAQLAALIHQTTHLFSKILEIEKIATIRQLFEDIEVSDYWQTHYKLDKPSKQQAKKLGDSAINLLIINTIVPFLFFYGREKGLPEYEERALKFLEETPAEQNHIIDSWVELKFRPANAYQTQALLELKSRYCEEKRCLSCTVGNSILKLEKEIEAVL